VAHGHRLAGGRPAALSDVRGPQGRGGLEARRGHPHGRAGRARLAPPTSWPACGGPSSSRAGASPASSTTSRGQAASIGSTEVAKAAPDGQTMLMGISGRRSIAIFTLPATCRITPKSLIPVSNVINPRLTCWWSIPRCRPQPCPSSSPGSGLRTAMPPTPPPHRPVAAPVGRLVPPAHTGTKAEHIPYRARAPALQDLTAGVTQVLLRQTSPPAASS